MLDNCITFREVSDVNARDIATLFAKQCHIRYSSTNFCLKNVVQLCKEGQNKRVQNIYYERLPAALRVRGSLWTIL